MVSSAANHVKTASPAKALALFRILFGAWLLVSVLPNLDRSFMETLPDQLTVFAYGNPWGVARWWITALAVPYADVVAMVVSVGQLLLGAALVLGFLTRQTTVLGLVFAVLLSLTVGHLSPFHHAFTMVLGGVFGFLWLSRAGQYYGIDAWLFAPRPVATSGGGIQFKNKKQRQAVEELAKSLKKQKGRQPVGV